MFNRKHKKELKEQAEKEGYVPTSQLEVDESGLSEEEKGKTIFPWSFVITAGVIALIMVVLMIIIFKVGVFDPKSSSNASSASNSGQVSETISATDDKPSINGTSITIKDSGSNESKDPSIITLK